jgi:class 3 adenylate cyclase
MDIASVVGAERLPEIKAALVDHAAVVVQRHGGAVDKVTGDGMMAVLSGRPRSALVLARPGTLCQCTM